MQILEPDHLRLNLGCGDHFHEDWVNVDLVARHKQVIQADLNRGIPFEDGKFAFVYHSHVLEHLTPEQARKFLTECHRVLQPGGTLRIVVPDLENICRLYLQHLDLAWDNKPSAAERYEWMKLELLDQMVRQQSGGRMGPVLARLEDHPQLANFVAERFGSEILSAKTGASAGDDGRVPRESWRCWWRRQRELLARKVVKLLLGRKGLRQMDEAGFRNQGEIHQWMYDRFSLRQLCTELGFEEFRLRSATESFDERFSSYELDAMDGKLRKPDSLYCECRKRPLAANQPHEDGSPDAQAA